MFRRYLSLCVGSAPSIQHGLCELRAFSAASSSSGPVQNVIRRKLEDRFQPSALQVENESYMHKVAPGAEKHFKVIIASDHFKNLPLIQRHRLVYDTLKKELSSGVHALRIDAYTNAEWKKNLKITPTPSCRGGFSL